ncbi:MAG: FtsX-like permease family protein [Eubacteriales bacterium]|nr:FtsX-like permease family protein [Eubacteriales bacterium]
MRNALLPHLAVRGLTGSRRLYLPFLLSTAFMAMVYTVIACFVHDPLLGETIAGGNNIQTLMSVGYLLLPVVLAPFLVYIYSYLLKNRSRELALYAILGLERRHIALVLLIENALCFAVSLLLGLGGGALVYPLTVRALLAALRLPAARGTLSAASLLGVTRVFAVCFALLVAIGVWRAACARPVSLLREQTQGEKPMRGRLPVAVGGVLCLLAAYTLSATSRLAPSLHSFMVALALVILGTYGVFTGVSAEVLRRLRRSPRMHTDASALVVVSGLQHRLRKNAAGLVNICLFGCAALFTLCCSFCVLLGQDTVIARIGRAVVEGQFGLNTADVAAREIEMLFTTLAFLGVFFVLVFLACTALVLYYKQLAESTEDVGRLRILRAVGLSDARAAHTVRRQLRTLFLLPLGGTLLHIAGATPFLCTFMSLLAIDAPEVIGGSVALAMLVFCLFYLLCYRATVRAYLRAVA